MLRTLVVFVTCKLNVCIQRSGNLTDFLAVNAILRIISWLRDKFVANCLKLGLGRPLPKTFKLHHVVDKVMNMSSGSSSVCTSSDSELESLSSQE